MRIWLCYIGKPRDPHLNAVAAEYLKRASRWVRCEMREIDPRRDEFWSRYCDARKILLEPAGRSLDSAAFREMMREAELRGQDLAFLVGGPEGFPAGWRERADVLWSLSALTLPHELARVIVAEQIYRALAGLHGHPYPR